MAQRQGRGADIDSNGGNQLVPGTYQVHDAAMA
jgi:hypothetical protein